MPHKWTRFVPPCSGEAESIDAFREGEALPFAQCLYDADGEEWHRSILIAGDEWDSLRPVRTLDGAIAWIRGLAGARRIEVTATFDIPLAASPKAGEEIPHRPDRR